MNDRIKALRKELRLSQAEFGEKIGVSRSVIANIELNRVAPKELLINHICDIFNVNPEWLTDGKDDMFVSEPRPNKNLQEVLTLFAELRPEFQDYVLKQIGQLLEMQNAQRDD